MPEHLPPEWHDRRDRAQTKALIEEVFKDYITFQSLKKNGHTWGQWFEKVLTPQNILLLILLIFNFGGRWQRFDMSLADLEEAKRRTGIMQQQHEHINQQLAEIVQVFQLSADAAGRTEMELSRVRELAERAIQQNSRIAQQVQQQPTRSELKATTQQQIVPRLDRLQKQIEELQQQP